MAWGTRSKPALWGSGAHQEGTSSFLWGAQCSGPLGVRPPLSVSMGWESRALQWTREGWKFPLWSRKSHWCSISYTLYNKREKLDQLPQRVRKEEDFLETPRVLELKGTLRTSLVGPVADARGQGSIPGQGTRAHILQLRSSTAKFISK